MIFVGGWAMSIEFWVQIIVYAITFGTTVGIFKTRLDYLEKKMDKHNQVQDRVTILEERTNLVLTRIEKFDNLPERVLVLEDKF